MDKDDSWGRDQWLGRDSEEWLSFPEENVMADEPKPRGTPRRTADAARPGLKSPVERPFDMWLHKQLHAMYDEIASEPLPNDLLNLIDRDATQDGAGEPARGATKPGGKKT
jgi:hypothetical protein